MVGQSVVERGHGDLAVLQTIHHEIFRLEHGRGVSVHSTSLPCSASLVQEVQVLTEEVIPVMWDDAKPSSHAITVKNLTSPAEITSIFDSITYSKGASVLRMLEKIVGADTFRDSLREYLALNAFDIGDPTVFYNKLFTNISGEEFLKNWLEEMNFPILNVHLQANENGTYVTFNQSRFIISDALDISHLASDYRWKISIQCVLGRTSSLATSASCLT